MTFINTPFHLPEMGCLFVKGEDAERFLQGQLTCNVNALALYSACMGAYCNPQGRVISVFHLFRDQTGFCLFMPRSMVLLTDEALKKYAVFFKCTLHDASDEYYIYGCWKDTLHQADLAANQTMFKIPISETRFLLINHLKPPVKETTEQPHNWHLANIDELLPMVYPETSGQFLPHDLNLDLLGAVSFEKGCYTGQEIIARMHYRGKVKKRLRHAVINNYHAQPGEPLLKQEGENTQTVAEIVDVGVVNQKKYKLLIVMNENDSQQNLFLMQHKKQIPISLNEENNYD